MRYKRFYCFWLPSNILGTLNFYLFRHLFTYFVLVYCLLFIIFKAIFPYLVTYFIRATIAVFNVWVLLHHKDTETVMVMCIKKIPT